MVKRILFVCSGNTCRSPMAQALFTSLQPETFRDKFMVESAGILAIEGMQATTEAIETMHLYGADLSSHRSRQIDECMIKKSDLILTMTAEHSNYLKEMYPEKTDGIYLLGDFVGQPDIEIYDPFGMGKKAYIKSAEQIMSLLQKLIKKLDKYNGLFEKR